jgi:primosomal replication protein N
VNCNRLALCGQIAERDELRYTPAGIPVVNFRLEHGSEQVEAGMQRQIQCEVNCIALDELAKRISGLSVGTAVKVEGFLSRKSRMSTQLVLHVNELTKLN